MRSNEPSILELAQLALDVYNDPAEDEIRKKFFNKNWRAGPTNNHRNKPKFDRLTMCDNGYPSYSCPVTGLYARIYYHRKANYCVLVIRGTEMSSLNDLVTDAGYMFNDTKLQQYEDVKDFYHEMKKYLKDNDKPEIKYVCGHSLGGILAKMIAPITHLPTCAFNSPGVLDFLISVEAKKFEKEKIPFKKNEILINLAPQQVIVTFIANKDMIGETKHHTDLGSRIYLATTLSNPHSVNEYKNSKELENILNDRFSNSSKYPLLDDPFTVHTMVDLFKYLYVNDYENVYIDKFKPFHKHHERDTCYFLVSLLRKNFAHDYDNDKELLFFNSLRDKIMDKKNKYCKIYDEHKENFSHYLATPLNDDLLKNPRKLKKY